MSKNTGTLVGAAIRPIDSNDKIASAFGNEVKGGHHSYATLNDRNNIIEERREWGMLCTIYNDGSNNGVYQLSYNYIDTNINNNSNWILFVGGGSSSGSKYWLDPVKTVLTVEPSSPTNGDRYLLGVSSASALSGANWSLLIGGSVVQWNSATSKWDVTLPLNDMSVRIMDQDNDIHCYNGSLWLKEILYQIKQLGVTSSNGINYTFSDDNIYQYKTDELYIVGFDSSNISTTATININGLGSKTIKKQYNDGLYDLLPGDINMNCIYNLTYDGTYFRMIKPTDGSLFNIKYIINSNESVYVPLNTQYFVYGDLTVYGLLKNDGKVIIANGALNISGGTVSNMSNVELVSFGSGTASATASNCCEQIDITYSALGTLKTNSTLEPGATYYITDKKIWIKALEIDKLSLECSRKQTIIKHDAYQGTGIYKGVWYPTMATPSIGDIVIWGGKLWSNVNGSVGGFDDDATLDTEWILVVSDSNYYDKVFSIKYDFDNDKIIEQSDDRDNIVSYNLNNVDNSMITDWGNNNIFNNKSYGIYNNRADILIYMNKDGGGIYRNYNNGDIYQNNIVTVISLNSNIGSIYKNISSNISQNSNNGHIYNNNVTSGINGNANSGSIKNNSVYSLYNNINGGSISDNFVYAIYNNSNNGPIGNNIINLDVANNSNDGKILYNTCVSVKENSNNGDIYKNIGLGYTNNSNNGSIKYNNILQGLDSISNIDDIQYNNCDKLFVIETNDSSTNNISFDLGGEVSDVVNILGIKAKIIAKSSDGIDVYYKEISGFYNNNSTYFTQIDGLDSIEKTSFSTATSNFNITNGVYSIDIIGEASRTINWVIKLYLDLHS